MRAVLDTNVIIDAIAARPPFYKEAQQILIMAAEDKIDAFITSNAATDIFYILRKHFQSPDVAKENLKKLFETISVLTVDEANCLNAIDSDIKDFEDAVFVESAKDGDVDYIVTNNVPDFTVSSIPAISTADFLKL